MRTLKEARARKDLSLRRLSDYCGIDWRRLSAFEQRTRFPTNDEQRKLNTAFGEKLYWGEKRQGDRAPKEVRKSFYRRFLPKWKPDTPPSVRRTAARADNGELYEALYRGIPEKSRWFLHHVCMDSQLEAFEYLWLLNQQWAPYIDSPQAFCFRSIAIVDPRSREHCPNRKVPLLLLDQGDVRIVLFPQLHLRPHKRIWRVDGLCCVSRGKQREWFVSEADGKGHRYSDDADKEREIGLPFLRFSTEQIMSDTFPGEFYKKAIELLMRDTNLVAA